MDKQSHFKKLAELFGVEIDEPFKMNWDNAMFRKNYYKISTTGVLTSLDLVKWQFVNSSINDMTAEKVIKIPKRPKAGEKYYYPCPYKGWEENIWLDSDFDNRVLNKVGVFENQQKAYEKAREMGWF